MEVANAGGASFRFSTRTLAPSKRLPAMREFFEQKVRLNIDSEPGRAIELTVDVAPGWRQTKMLSSFSARLERPAPMLADGDDALCLMIKTAGCLSLVQRQHEAAPQIGDGALLVYREPAILQFRDATYHAVRVPLAALAGLAIDIEAAAARCIPRHTEALSLLRSYLANLPARISDPQLGRLSAMHVYDLIALAIGATNEGRELARQRGVRAARFEAIKADLFQNAGLDLDQLAVRQGISPRYIQMLFEEAGTTFSDFALERRLDVARSMLASPRYATWSVVAIALEAGFGDLSHFNKRFKRRYHMTPSDMRARTKRDGMQSSDV